MERSLASRVWRGFLLLVAVVVLVGHVLGGWIYSGRIIDQAFTPPTDDVQLPDWEFATPAAAGLSATDVTYESPLGPMDAWVVDGTRSEWVIHVHGEGASRNETLRAMQFLSQAGYHQMSIAYRNDQGQPADPSGQYRYGVTELDDLSAAVEYAKSEGASEVILFGYSAGAAIAQSYVIRQPVGTVAAMVFDSPNLDLGRAIEVEAGQDDILGVPIPFTVTAIARFFTALRVDVNWGSFDYLERAKSLSMPILVLHGDEDLTVPLEISNDLVGERPDLVSLVVTEGAGHLQSWNVDQVTYEQAVVDFLAQ